MNYKQMCIQQGYIPSTCKLDGQMAWLLVKEGKDPCKGCNENRKYCNGRYAPYESKEYQFFCSLDLIGELERKQIEEKRKRREEIIQKRKERHMNGYTRTILEVKWNYSSREPAIEILVKDIVNEKVYIKNCKDIYEMLSIVMACCSKFKVEQIHVEENGYGTSIYNYLAENIKDIDIVPLKYLNMKL